MWALKAFFVFDVRSFAMKLPSIVAGITLLLSLSTSLAADSSAAPSKSDCNKSCLLKILNDYQNKMLKHETAGISLADNFRSIENYEPIKLGDGYWKRVTKIYDQLQFADPVSGQVAAVGKLNDDNKDAYYTLRLKVEPGRKISQSEMLLIHDGEASFLQKDPNVKISRIYLQTLPKAQRSSREQMIKIVDGFTDAWQFKDEDLMQFTEDCAFYENNVMLSEPGITNCGDMLEYNGKHGVPGKGTTAMRGVDNGQAPTVRPADPSIGRPQLQGSQPWVRDRRVPLVDEETGTVLAFHIQGGEPARPGEEVVYRRAGGFGMSSQTVRRSAEENSRMLSSGPPGGMPGMGAGGPGMGASGGQGMPPQGARGAAYMSGLLKIVNGKLVQVDHFEWEGGPNASGGFSDGPPN